MYGYRRMLGAGFCLCLAAGCGSSSSSGSGGEGFIQLINGMEDSPGLFAEIEEDDDLLETVSTLGFRQASSLLTFGRGTYDVDVYFVDPESGFNERLLAAELDVQSNTIYQGVLTGTFSDPQLVWFEKPEGDVVGSDEEEVEVQALNLSAGSVSVYLGDEDDGFNAETLVATLAAGVASDPTVIAFDDDADYVARVTLEGVAELTYDSERISLPQASRRTLVVTDSTGPDPTVKSLFVVTDSGTEVYPNSVARSGFRVVHAVADAPDVQATVEVASSGEVLAGATLLFGDATSQTVAGATFVDVLVNAPSTSTETVTVTASLDEDTAYAFVVGGSIVEDDIAIRANELDFRSVANSINVHIVNALTETDDEDVSAVDFYALPLGDSLSDTAPAATNVGFLEGRNAILPATAYDLVVTTAGTQSILAGPARIFPVGGERVLSVAAEAAGGGLPNQIINQIED